MWLIRHPSIPVSPAITIGRVAGLLCIPLLLVAALGGATAAPSPVVGPDGGVHAMSPPAPVNNTSVQHEDPDRVDESGDLGSVSGWLSTRLAQQLSGSTLNLSQAQYQQARRLLGDEYNSQLEKYVDVAGDTQGSSDNRAAEQFDAAQETQQEYVQRVESYRETYAAYQTAKQNGNTTRARRLARTLSETARELQQLNQTLLTDYTRIENQTDVSLAEAGDRISTITRNITAQQREITAAEFTATTLRVTADRTAISFTSPLELQGRLELENGTRITNQTITLVVANQTYQPRLDSQGTFTISYRPVRAPLDTTALQVRYRPDPTSPYVGANTTQPVSITKTTPTVSLTTNETTVGFGDTITVTGTVTANQTGVPRVPLTLGLPGANYGSVTTDQTGQFQSTIRIGATPPPGTHDLTGTVALQNRAIASVGDSTELRVESTATDLHLDARVTNDMLEVSGRLETVAGQPVSGQTVVLELPDRTISVQTALEGRFSTRTPLEANGTAVDLTASFSGQGTNLDGTTASETVHLPAHEPDASTSDGGVREWAMEHPVGRSILTDWRVHLLGAVLLAILGGLGVGAYRRRTTEPDTPDAVPGVATDSNAAGSTTSESGFEAGVSTVEARLSAGDTTGAVRQLYAVVRRELDSEHDLSAGTHWEFYQAAESAEVGADWVSVLGDITELYERAVFAEQPVDSETVQALIDSVPGRS